MIKFICEDTYNGFDSSEFDDSRMNEIRKGLESGVDISQYADPKFYARQMRQIRLGLESGIDISQYADPKIDGPKMEEIRLGLESGVDISWYANPKKFTSGQMEEIRKGLESGVDVSVYADPKFDWSQMREIREGLESGVDVSQYGVDVSQYAEDLDDLYSSTTFSKKSKYYIDTILPIQLDQNNDVRDYGPIGSTYSTVDSDYYTDGEVTFDVCIGSEDIGRGYAGVTIVVLSVNGEEFAYWYPDEQTEEDRITATQLDAVKNQAREKADKVMENILKSRSSTITKESLKNTGFSITIFERHGSGAMVRG